MKMELDDIADDNTCSCVVSKRILPIMNSPWRLARASDSCLMRDCVRVINFCIIIIRPISTRMGWTQFLVIPMQCT